MKHSTNAKANEKRSNSLAKKIVALGLTVAMVLGVAPNVFQARTVAADDPVTVVTMQARVKVEGTRSQKTAEPNTINSEAGEIADENGNVFVLEQETGEPGAGQMSVDGFIYEIQRDEDDNCIYDVMEKPADQADPETEIVGEDGKVYVKVVTSEPKVDEEGNPVLDEESNPIYEEVITPGDLVVVPNPDAPVQGAPVYAYNTPVYTYEYVYTPSICYDKNDSGITKEDGLQFLANGVEVAASYPYQIADQELIVSYAGINFKIDGNGLAFDESKFSKTRPVITRTTTTASLGFHTEDKPGHKATDLALFANGSSSGTRSLVLNNGFSLVAPEKIDEFFEVKASDNTNLSVALENGVETVKSTTILDKAPKSEPKITTTMKVAGQVVALKEYKVPLKVVESQLIDGGLTMDGETVEKGATVLTKNNKPVIDLKFDKGRVSKYMFVVVDEEGNTAPAAIQAYGDSKAISIKFNSKLSDGTYTVKRVVKAVEGETNYEEIFTFVIDATTPKVTVTTDTAEFFKKNSTDPRTYIYADPIIKKEGQYNKTEYVVPIIIKIEDADFDAEAYKTSIGCEDDDFSGKDGVYTYKMYLTGEMHQSIDLEAMEFGTIKDRAGNPAELTSNHIVSTKEGSASVAPNAVSIDAEGTLTVDTLSIDAQVPYSDGSADLEIKLEGNTAKADGAVFYKGERVRVNVKVTDGSGVGVKKEGVTAWIENNQDTIDTAASSEESAVVMSGGSGAYSTLFDLNDNVEADDVQVMVKAEDKVGNLHYAVKSFSIDKKKPVITASYDNNASYKDRQYFKKASDEATATRTLTVEVNDIHFDEANAFVIVNGKKETVTWSEDSDNVWTATFPFVEDGTYEVAAEAKDLAGNKTDNKGVSFVDGTTHPNAFVVDNTAPQLSIAYKGADCQNIVNGRRYYDSEQEVSVTIKELNFDADAADKEDPKDFVVDRTATLDGNDISDSSLPERSDFENDGINHKVTYTYTADGDYDLTANYTDLAGNKATTASTSFAIDNIDPEIKLNLPGEGTNSKGKINYYNNKQTIGFDLTERNLDTEKSYITYYVDETEVTKTIKELGLTPTNNKYSWSLHFENQSVRNLEVYAIDYANREGKVSDDHEYISDTTKPTVDLSVTGNEITGYFKNGNSVFVNFASQAKAESGRNAGASTKTVTITATVKDKNIQTNSNDGYAKDYKVYNKSGNGFTGAVAKNTDSTVTMTKTISVPSDASGTLKVDFVVKDLAGNDADAITYSGTLNSLATSSTGQSAYTIANGEVTGKVTVDQERPSSVNNEHQTPVITLTPKSGKAGTVTNSAGKSVDLYAGSMSYALSVYDPAYTDEDGQQQYSGLDSVKWTVESDKAGLIGGSQDHSGLGQVQSANFSIPVSISGTGETNNITVTVTATDKAGNETTYKEYLAIDNQAPRVTISYNNNSAQNGKYFKADRVATIKVEDLNFDPSRTTVTTEKGFSGWSQSGNVYTGTVNYNSDGDYTFDMSTADKANNKATIDFTNNGANVVPKAFTIDKTAPVITVNFDNNDSRNGKYYNSDRNATVTVKEHNFNASEVRVSQTGSLDGQSIATPGVGGFGNSGDNHSAGIAYTQDGDYTITVNYTDLAGNPAQVVTVSEFTIDKTAPKAEIKGVKNGQAFTGSVNPIVSMTDINYDPNGATFKWTVTKIGGSSNLDVKKSQTFIAHGVEYNLEDLPKTRENDGIYTLYATVTDLAGNSYTTGKVTYSVNRFGSVYTYGDKATENLIKGQFSKTAQPLKIVETNPNKLSSAVVNLSVNGAIKTLEENKDYTCKEISGANQWSQYEYTILESAFMDENGNLIQGEYVISLLSTDLAGNENSNRTNIEENSLELTLTLDDENPTGYMNVAGLMEGKNTIQAASTNIDVYWEDNIGTAKVTIKLNDQIYKELEGEELAEANGHYVVEVQESNDEQSIEVILTDYAGNEGSVEKISFYLNSSAFMQFMHNTPLFVGTIVGMLAIIALLIFIILKRRKKDEKAA